MRRSTIIILASVFLSAGAGAQAVECDDADDQATMNRCADAAYLASDAALNEAYRALVRSLDADGLAMLKAAQRAWIAYRDAQCAFDTAAAVNASVYPMLVAACRDELTQAQTARLNAQLSCEEGDLSCARR